MHSLFRGKRGTAPKGIEVSKASSESCDVPARESASEPPADPAKARRWFKRRKRGQKQQLSMELGRVYGELERVRGENELLRMRNVRSDERLQELRRDGLDKTLVNNSYRIRLRYASLSLRNIRRDLALMRDSWRSGGSCGKQKEEQANEGNEEGREDTDERIDDLVEDSSKLAQLVKSVELLSGDIQATGGKLLLQANSHTSTQLKTSGTSKHGDNTPQHMDNWYDNSDPPQDAYLNFSDMPTVPLQKAYSACHISSSSAAHLGSVALRRVRSHVLLREDGGSSTHSLPPRTDVLANLKKMEHEMISLKEERQTLMKQLADAVLFLDLLSGQVEEHKSEVSLMKERNRTARKVLHRITNRLP